MEPLSIKKLPALVLLALAELVALSYQAGVGDMVNDMMDSIPIVG